MVRHPFLIPPIRDTLNKLEGLRCASTLDLSMGYWHITLDLESQNKCVVTTPWGRYAHQRLPMGLCASADVFQQRMTDMCQALECVRVCIDDALCITKGDFDDHLQKLEQLLKRLGEAGLKVKASKCRWAVGEAEYLGYLLTQEGVKPLANKVEAILGIERPKTRKELCRFIGMINFYRDAWKGRSETLAPLTALTSKIKKWKWTEEHESCFERMKKIIAQEVLLAYPDFTKEFVVHTDASGLQLGGVISHNGKPLGFYSRKLNAAQQLHATTERELLSIVETLKEYRAMLLGHKIKVYTDHLDLLHVNTNSPDRVQRWRLLLEECGAELTCIKGVDNVVADSLSRMEIKKISRKELIALNEQESQAKKEIKRLNALRIPTSREGLIPETKTRLNTLKSKINDSLINASFACIKRPFIKNMDSKRSRRKTKLKKHLRMQRRRRNKPKEQSEQQVAPTPDYEPSLDAFPLTWAQVEKEQKASHQFKELMRKVKRKKEEFSLQKFCEHSLITKEGKIFLPEGLQHTVVAWYHEMLRHPGTNRLKDTMRQTFYAPGMGKIIEEHTKKCAKCQTHKRTKKKYGSIHPKQISMIPWETVCVDLVGPYSVKTDRGDHSFHALTIMDPVTNWIEIVDIDHDKTSENIALAFDRQWLSRYPRPSYCIFDKGSEFIGTDFQELLESFGIKKKPITTKNPQSNAIIERMHQTLGDMLRIYDLDKAMFDDKDPWAGYIASISWALRATVHATLQASPAQLVFGRDMILPLSFQANWEELRAQRQQRINKDNKRENRNRIHHEYKVGDKVLVTDPLSVTRKLKCPTAGPYIVLRVHQNGTARMQRGAVAETLNMRRLRPFYE